MLNVRNLNFGLSSLVGGRKGAPQHMCIWCMYILECVFVWIVGGSLVLGGKEVPQHICICECVFVRMVGGVFGLRRARVYY